MGSLDELIPYLGADAVTVLARWAQLTGRTVDIPAQSWHARGYTDARLAQLFVTEAGLGTQLVVVKVLPSAQAEEAAAHRRALLEAPAAFRGHLVGLAFDPVPVGLDRALTFQQVAGHSADWRPLATLPTSSAPAVCEVVTHSLIKDWNHDFRVKKVSVVDLLVDEIGDVDPVYRSIERFQAMASPHSSAEQVTATDLLFTTRTSALFGQQVDVIVGRIHGDLHDFNVLVRQSRAGISPETFTLVDLTTYTSSGQLGCDLVRLLLSVMARVLLDASASERALLIELLVQPEAAAPGSLAPMTIDIVRAVYGPAANLLERCGWELWRKQYLLSLLGQALVSTTFESRATLHSWFYQLAARTATELMIHFDGSEEAPRVVTAGAPHLASLAHVNPSRTYSASKRSAVCSSLGDDWKDLALRLGIPPDTLNGAARGRQPYALWDRVAGEGRLAEITAALRDLGRGDLARILEGK